MQAAAEKGGQSTGGPSFSALLEDAMGSVLDAGKKSDAQTMAMTSGKANVMDVVTAVAETDVAVSTLVSVRDRVIQVLRRHLEDADLTVLILRRRRSRAVAKDGPRASWFETALRASSRMSRIKRRN